MAKSRDHDPSLVPATPEILGGIPIRNISASEFLDMPSESMNESEIENDYLMMNEDVVPRKNKGLLNHKNVQRTRRH